MKPNKVITVDIVNTVFKKSLLNCIKSVILKNKMSKWIFLLVYCCLIIILFNYVKCNRKKKSFYM